MTEQFLLNGATTAIGSVPGADAGEAVRFILDGRLDIPVWPQLPQRSFWERMIPQYSEGLPFLRVDEREKRIWCDVPEDKSEGLTEFYQKFLAGDVDAFENTPRTAAGLYAFLDEVKARSLKFECIKGSVTGPVTMTLGIADREKRPIFYDADMRDAAVKLLAMKARWQIRLLAPYCARVLIFLDEPVLASFGTSAYLGLTAEDVRAAFSEIIEVIHEEDALAGVHCCGNTDWSMVMSAGFDVVNFDAYEYAHNVALYPETVSEFLRGGGVFAWGIVPTTDEIDSVDARGLWKKLEEGMSLLTAKGIAESDLRRQCLLTPSCGAGGLRPEQCEKVFNLLFELKEKFRKG